MVDLQNEVEYPGFVERTILISDKVTTPYATIFVVERLGKKSKPILVQANAYRTIIIIHSIHVWNQNCRCQ